MEKVTYTIAQLEAFSIAELKTLDLYTMVDSKGLKKAELVKAMFDAQENLNAPKEEATDETSKESLKEEDEVKDEAPKVEEEENEEIQSEEKSEKIVFHRKSNIRRNPMTFR